MKVIKSGNEVYLRSKWQGDGDEGDVYDYVQQLKMEQGENNVFQYYLIGLIGRYTLDVDVPTTPLIYLKTCEDVSPQWVNRTWLGGNHGASVVMLVKVT